MHEASNDNPLKLNGFATVTFCTAVTRTPGWYRNILANPDVEVQVGTAKTKARARTATGEERALLWQDALRFWPPYADYRQKTERQIPVVVLQPTDSRSRSGVPVRPQRPTA